MEPRQTRPTSLKNLRQINKLSALPGEKKPKGQPCQVCGDPVDPCPWLGSWHQPALCKPCQDEEEANEAKIDRQRKYKQSLKYSNLPKAAMSKSVSFAYASKLADKGIASATALRACQTWEYGPTGLYLFGPVGSGKTYLAQCVLKRQIWLKRWGFYLDVPKYLDIARQEYRSDEKRISREHADKATKAFITVMDDLGTEQSGEWTHKNILPIINARMDALKPTIISSNLSLDQLDNRLGERIASRVAQACQLIKVEVRQGKKPVDIRVELAMARKTTK
jgi:DNA replication protein DnaC